MRLTSCVSAIIVFAGLAGAARPVRAQSLGDLARQEEDRRKDVKAPAKLYTNKDLGAPPPTSATSPDAGTPAAGGAQAAPATPGAADKAKDAAKDGPARDQKYWSARKKDLDSKLDRDKVLADAMQSRINGLTTDFAARSDPAQRAVIERDRQRAVSELDALQKSIKDDQKALTDFDEEARKAAVPPGWLR
jgi:hypothetical protein